MIGRRRETELMDGRLQTGIKNLEATSESLANRIVILDERLLKLENPPILTAAQLNRMMDHQTTAIQDKLPQADAGKTESTLPPTCESTEGEGHEDFTSDRSGVALEYARRWGSTISDAEVRAVTNKYDGSGYDSTDGDLRRMRTALEQFLANR